MDVIIATARTMDGAVTKALIELETANDKLEYEVADEGSTEFLGTGAKPAIIHAEKKEPIEDKTVDSLSRIFETMNIQVNITAAYSQEEQELSLNPEGEDMGILIDKRGQTLDSLQCLVNLIVNKGAEGYLGVKLGTENYRERRKETLEILAKSIAHKAKRTKRPVSPEPMNPYERRIIHTAFQNDKYVTTRNEGEGPFRHVAIALRKEATPSGRKGRYDRDKGGRYGRSDRPDGYRDNRRTNGNNASWISPDTPTGTATGEEG